MKLKFKEAISVPVSERCSVAESIDFYTIEEEDFSRRSITKNRPVFRLSLEKKIPPKSPEIALSDKIRERPIAKKEEVHQQRFSFFKCFTGNAKTQDQNQSSRKRNTEKKKHFLCLCWNMAYRCSIQGIKETKSNSAFGVQS